jgi:Protein of unknown function (DUF2630)
MEDIQVIHHIRNLTEKEDRLWDKADLTEDDTVQLHKIKLELDQAWDLLSQRRALRDARKDPNKAEERDIDTIENYEQ